MLNYCCYTFLNLSLVDQFSLLIQHGKNRHSNYILKSRLFPFYYDLTNSKV